MEHPYFYAPTFSRDLYELLMIRYILNSKLWGKKYVVKTQVHKSSIFKLVLLFIRYSFKVAPFMNFAMLFKLVEILFQDDAVKSSFADVIYSSN